MRVILLSLLMMFGVTLGAMQLQAADVTPDFSAANKLYAEGKFPAAAAAYEKILATGAQSAPLLFNCANAEYKAGNLGAAIASYRRAALLSPQDAEIRANLAFVRNQVQGTTVRENPWQGWLGQFSLNAWTWFTVLALWLTFILLAAGQFRPALAPKLRALTQTFGALTIFFGALTGVQAAQHFSHTTAVVTTDGAVVRSGPFNEAQNVFTLHDGAELPVMDRHDDWVQVDAGAGKTGWLPVKQVSVLPGA